MEKELLTSSNLYLKACIFFCQCEVEWLIVYHLESLKTLTIIHNYVRFLLPVLSAVVFHSFWLKSNTGTSYLCNRTMSTLRPKQCVHDRKPLMWRFFMQLHYLILYANLHPGRRLTVSQYMNFAYTKKPLKCFVSSWLFMK